MFVSVGWKVVVDGKLEDGLDDQVKVRVYESWWKRKRKKRWKKRV